MAEATASFGVQVTDESSAGVTSSTNNLEKLRGTLKSDIAELSNMNRALKNLQGGTSVNIQQFKNLKQAIADKKVAIAATQSKELQLAAAMGKVGKSSLSMKDQFKKGLEGAGGPVGELSGKVMGLVSKLGTGGLVGVAILAAAALVAVGVAAAAAFIGLAKFGLAAADAHRSEALMLEGLAAVPMFFGIWQRSMAGAGPAIQHNIDMVSAGVANSREQVVGLATDLMRMGIKSQATLKALADAQSAGGERGLAWAKNMLQWYQMSGQGASAAAKIIEAKFGATAAKQALGFGVQMMKLKENVKSLFSGIKIEGFLKSLKSVTELFSVSTVTGRALKQIIETVFNGFFGSVASGGPMVKDMIRDIVIGVQGLIIKWLDLRIWMLEVFNTKWDSGWMYVVKGILVGVLGLLGGIAAVLTVIIIKVSLILLPFLLLGAAIIAAAASMYFLVDQIVKAVKEISWYDIGHYLIGGIADGIADGAKWVWSAIKNLASGAVTAFKTLLGIHSPSLIFKMQGRYVPLGFAEGIRAGQPDVNRAITRMAELPPMGSYAGAPAGAGAMGRATTTIAPVFNIDIQSTDPKGVVDELEDRVNTLFAGVAKMIGAT